MPNYSFLNTETNEESTIEMKMSEYDDFVAANPSLQRIYFPLGICDPHRMMGVVRTPNAWKDVLSNVAKENKNLWSGGTHIDVR